PQILIVKPQTTSERQTSYIAMKWQFTSRGASNSNARVPNFSFPFLKKERQKINNLKQEQLFELRGFKGENQFNFYFNQNKLPNRHFHRCFAQPTLNK
ncbi:MAG: hypothetical protein IKJ31_04065, partial [Bacteroidaceae bacterium]|nr:hypothetical protein [Bacteroidaceae bacterium]